MVSGWKFNVQQARGKVVVVMSIRSRVVTTVRKMLNQITCRVAKNVF